MKREEIDKIESYLANNLSGQELLDFESEIGRNKELKGEIDAHRAALEIIVDHELIALKSKVSQFLDTTSSGSEKRKRLFKNTSYTGIIVVILSASLWVWNKQALNPGSDSTERSLIMQEEPRQSDMSDPEDIKLEDNVSQGEILDSSLPANTQSNRVPKEALPAERMLFAGSSIEPKTPESSTLVRESVMEKMEKRIPLNSSNLLPQLPERLEITELLNSEKDQCSWERLGDEIWVEEKCLNGTVHLPSGWIEMIEGNELHVSLMPDSQELIGGAYPAEQGFFTLTASDNRGCKYQRQIIIEGDNCTKESNVFSPEKGEKLNFELRTDHKGRISIYSRSGLFVKEIPYSSNQPVYWDGYDHSNSLVPLGIYFFVVVDELGNERDRGTVYVIR